MKFTQLVDEQNPKLKEIVLAKYMVRQMWGGTYISLEVETIKKVCEGLPSELVTKFKQLVEKNYLIGAYEASDLFTETELASLRESGLLFLSLKYQEYIVPEEMLEVLFSGSLIAELVATPKKILVRSVPNDMASLSKDLIVKAVIQNKDGKFEYFRDVQVDSYSDLLTELKNYLPYLGTPKSKPLAWDEELASLLGISSRSWGFDVSAIEKEFQAAFDNLFRKRILVWRHDKYSNLHPQVYLGSVIADRLMEEHRRSVEQTLHAQFTSALEVVAQPSHVRFHISPDDLLRRLLVVTEAFFGGQVELTNNGAPRVADLKRIAKIFSSKVDISHEATRLGSLLSLAFRMELLRKRESQKSESKNSESKADKTTTLPLFDLTSSKLSVLCKQAEEPLRDEAYKIWDAVPAGTWIAVDLILETVRLIVPKVFRPIVTRQLVDKIYREWLLGGTCDVVLGAKGQIEAVRRISEAQLSSDDRLLPLSEEVFMQSNFDVAMPPNLHPKKVYEVCKLLSLNTPYLAVLDANAINKALGADLDSAKLISSLDKVFSSPLPDSARRFIAESMKAKLSMNFVSDPIFYVRTAEEAALVRKLAKDRIKEVIDEKVFILREGRYDQILKNLKRNGAQVKVFSEVRDREYGGEADWEADIEDDIYS